MLFHGRYVYGVPGVDLFCPLINYFQRALFPSYAYDLVSLEEQTEPPRYDEFVQSARRTTPSDDSDCENLGIYLLRKGRSTRVDSFLEILVCRRCIPPSLSGNSIMTQS